jgi:hypothetical protein
LTGRCEERHGTEGGGPAPPSLLSCAAFWEAIVLTPRSYSDLRSFGTEILERREDPSLPPVLRPSEAWRTSARQFRYVHELPDSELARIRFHTYHLTSDIYLTYAVDRPELRLYLTRACELIRAQLGHELPDEGPEGIGFNVDGRRISIDLVRYLQVVADLYAAGVDCRRSPNAVLEIGGGYGGFAAAFVSLHPASACVLLDLEETLFFQAVHLCNRFGFDAVSLCSEVPTETEPGRFYLVPQSASESLRKTQFDLVINQQSMQEMTREQVERYCALVDGSTRLFYSCNRHEHAGCVAAGMGVVRNLTQLLESRFPRVLWKAEGAETGYGDAAAALPRRLFACSGRVAPGGRPS